MVWLAATNHFLYAEVFRENEITGTKLRHLTDTSLNQMNISDNFHKQSILLAIQELFTGESETVSVNWAIVYYNVLIALSTYTSQVIWTSCMLVYLFQAKEGQTFLLLLNLVSLEWNHFWKDECTNSKWQ